jgi:hypothetical protein
VYLSVLKAQTAGCTRQPIPVAALTLHNQKD